MTVRRTGLRATGAVVFLLLMGVMGVPLLALLPAAILVGLLSIDRYPGEEAIVRLRSMLGRRRSRVPSPRGASRSGFTVRAPRGSALLAYCRAVRPPPQQLFSV